MAQYRVSETPVEDLSAEQVREEAGDLRHQLTCVTSDLASKVAWVEADGTSGGQEYKIWKAKARAFWSKLQKRYSLVRRREAKLNRAELTSKRHVTRDEFTQHIKDTTK